MIKNGRLEFKDRTGPNRKCLEPVDGEDNVYTVSDKLAFGENAGTPLNAETFNSAFNVIGEWLIASAASQGLIKFRLGENGQNLYCGMPGVGLDPFRYDEASGNLYYKSVSADVSPFRYDESTGQLYYDT
jgi:hypothetical protein